MLWVHRYSAGLTQGADTSLDITFQVDKPTTLWSLCTSPLLRHTPSFAVDGGKTAADLRFCFALWVADTYDAHHDDLSLLFKFTHVTMALNEHFQET